MQNLDMFIRCEAT